MFDMISPNPTAVKKYFFLTVMLAFGLLFSACGKTTKAEAEPSSTRLEELKKPAPAALPMWLGNPERNFFGTGPWSDKPLEVAWNFKTGSVRGPLHPDPWGGSGWPGQVAVVGDRVYFQSADSYIYCLSRSDGSVIWKFQTTDCAKSAPSVSGDRLVVGNLDHYVYCLNTNDGSLVWKYQTGFETDSSSAIIGDRVYVGGEDHYYYCFNLADGKIIFKTQLNGSMEGGTTIVDGRIYADTKAGGLYCLNADDGKIIWTASLGWKSTSTPAVVNNFVYTATVNGYVFCFNKETGELIWKFNGNAGGGGGETNGFWASPIVLKNRIYIGSNNGYLCCLTDDGELVWRYKSHGPIWGTSPVVEGRVVFGDKAGWVHLISAEDGKQISEIKIGDNVDATPAVLDSRIYIGAFNGNFYCLKQSGT
jgi:outer membrane protein assembly factor BamB